MGNGGGLLFIAAVCWLALGAYLIGAMLRRAELTKSIGEGMNKFAFVLFVLGTGMTALIVLSYVNTSDFFTVAGLYGMFVGIPVLVCAIQFYRTMPRRKRDY